MNLYVRLVSYCSFVNHIARMKAQLGNIACRTPIPQEAAGNRPLKRKYLALVTVYKPVTQESSCFCWRAQHSRWRILINMSNSNRLSQTFCVTRPAEILTGVITPSPGKLSRPTRLSEAASSLSVCYFYFYLLTLQLLTGEYLCSGLLFTTHYLQESIYTGQLFLTKSLLFQKCCWKQRINKFPRKF